MKRSGTGRRGKKGSGEDAYTSYDANDILLSLKPSLSEVSKQVSSTEAATKSHEKRNEEQERCHDNVASQCIQQQAKLKDLEARSRWQNIHIVGIKEKTEAGQPTEFVTMLLPKLLGDEHFDLR